MSAPYSYDSINTAAAQVSPGTIHSQNTALVAYYRRYLFDRAISVFKWKIPEGWNKTYFLYSIYGIGFIAVINTDQFGIIPQHGTLGGRGVFYQPTHVCIANPLLNQAVMPEIGKDTEIIKLRPDYFGILDLVNDYAEQMALTSELFSVNTLNSRLSYVFMAGDKRSAESYKLAMDKLYSGNPMVVMDKALFGPNGEPCWQLLLQDVGQNYLAGEALENLRRLECKFNNEIGLPANLATQKKERTISAEVEANDAETYGRAAAWLESLQDGCERVRNMFGVEITVDWRVDPMQIREEESYESDVVVSGNGESGSQPDKR